MTLLAHAHLHLVSKSTTWDWRLSRDFKGLNNIKFQDRYPVQHIQSFTSHPRGVITSFQKLIWYVPIMRYLSHLRTF